MCRGVRTHVVVLCTTAPKTDSPTPNQGSQLTTTHPQPRRRTRLTGGLAVTPARSRPPAATPTARQGKAAPSPGTRGDAGNQPASRCNAPCHGIKYQASSVKRQLNQFLHARLAAAAAAATNDTTKIEEVAGQAWGGAHAPDGVAPPTQHAKQHRGRPRAANPCAAGVPHWTKPRSADRKGKATPHGPKCQYHGAVHPKPEHVDAPARAPPTAT